MTYRLRNIQTQATVLQGADFIAEDDSPVWVLEFEAAEGEWQSSGFHRKDINGVLDPRPFSETLAALKEVST
jgi:hypothetical protein